MVVVLLQGVLGRGLSVECSLRSHPRVDCSFPGISNLIWLNFTGGLRSWYWLGSLPYLSLRWEEVRGGLMIPASDEGRRPGLGE